MSQLVPGNRNLPYLESLRYLSRYLLRYSGCTDVFYTSLNAFQWNAPAAPVLAPSIAQLQCLFAACPEGEAILTEEEVVVAYEEVRYVLSIGIVELCAYACIGRGGFQSYGPPASVLGMHIQSSSVNSAEYL